MLTACSNGSVTDSGSVAVDGLSFIVAFSLFAIESCCASERMAMAPINATTASPYKVKLIFFITLYNGLPCGNVQQEHLLNIELKEFRACLIKNVTDRAAIRQADFPLR